MRDAPSGAPIPDEFIPSTYHKDAIEKAKEELLVTYTIEEAQASLDEEYENKVRNNEKVVEERKALSNRYNAMLQEVIKWEAPSEDHRGLKDFCIKQLIDSMNHDCDYSHYSETPEKESVEQWIANKREHAEKHLRYHEEEWEKEKERIANRNNWVKLLRNSLDKEVNP
jgi:sugar-specific transcriptional regulator TrmB